MWDVQDIEVLYAQYAQAIYKYLLSLKCDDQTAEDIVQETFYQAIRSIHRYDGSCKISVWLCQIAKHLWYQELTRRSKVSVNELTAEIADDSQAAIDQMIERESHDRLREVIRELPDVSQQVVVFRLYHHMSFREIGLVLGKTENWARVTYYRGKKTIMERWHENGS